MSVYKSSAIITNTTSTTIVVGPIEFAAGSSVTFWNTIGSVQPAILAIFAQVREAQAEIANLIESGELTAVKDGLTLDKAQFLTVVMAMANAVDTAKNIQELASPINTRPVQDNGVPLSAQAPRRGGDWVIGSHNFADRCSWFQDSVRVNGEALTDSGDGYTFHSAHNFWIDMNSGRQHNEGFWLKKQVSDNPSDPHMYKVKVFVDGVEATMREPFATEGGDYEVIWEDGNIVFFGNKAGKTITADYSYATTSFFHVTSRDSKKSLVVEDAEADISLDVIMNDELIYSWWYFDGSDWVCAGEYSYARVSQIATEARGAYPVFKATGSTVEEKALPLREFRRKSRGMYADRQAMPFNYTTVRELQLGVELRIYTRHHRELGGEHVSITLYCSEDNLT
jgi:hypothetical protein